MNRASTPRRSRVVFKFTLPQPRGEELPRAASAGAAAAGGAAPARSRTPACAGIPFAGRLADGAVAKVGRNDPCPCGSGKKYKKCCGAA